MKPLSERLKDFPTSQFVDWLCLACVDVREVRTPDDAQEEINKIREAVAERLVALEQRAEAAEANHQSCTNELVEAVLQIDALRAKLAELEKQANEPAGYAPKGHVERYLSGKNSGCWVYGEPTADENEPLFTRPAPAINLAELVPPKASMADFYENVPGGNRSEPDEAGIAMWDACCAAMLRNIEGRND